MSEDAIEICRRCWWAAEVTRKDEEVWCSHRHWHGWMKDAPACNGDAYMVDDDRDKGAR